MILGNPVGGARDHDSKDTDSVASQLGQPSASKVDMSQDWRTYFQEKELDQAFQLVEIE
jgi:hypothetical protein